MRPSDRSFVRRIDVTSLQLFVAVCELGSIGKAAERESLASSAVSKRLSDLEAALDTQLFYRHARGVAVTPAGESLLHHARAVLHSLATMQGEISEYADGVKGHVRIHANMSAIVQYLPEDLGAFVRTHPQVKIEMKERLSLQIPRAVQDGATDLGICSANGLPEGHGLQVLPYRQDELGLVVPRDHPLARHRSVQFTQSLDYDHVGLHSDSSIALAMAAAAQAGHRQVPLRIQVTSLDALCRMIENGLGIGVMPRRAFELTRGTAGLRCLRLRDDWALRRIDLVARDFQALPVTARQLVQYLQRRAGATRAPRGGGAARASAAARARK